jgi:hypothetical protein
MNPNNSTKFNGINTPPQSHFNSSGFTNGGILEKQSRDVPDLLSQGDDWSLSEPTIIQS